MTGGVTGGYQLVKSLIHNKLRARREVLDENKKNTEILETKIVIIVFRRLELCS